MSAISKLIFNGAEHYVTSPFGARSTIKTSAGNTSSYHSGTDYGTNSKKIAQYAIEDGYVMDAARASDGALYVWVIYPRCKLAMLHYHLDSYKVKAGQKVSKGTLLGYTGMTGKATGIHLHLGVKPLTSVSSSKLNSITYSILSGISYVDPEKVSYTAPTATQKTTQTTKSSFLPSRGYFQKGDVSPKIGKIATFLRKSFPLYTDKKALGETFGPYLLAAVKEFQKRSGLGADGLIGPKTLAKLKEYGFKE